MADTPPTNEEAENEYVENKNAENSENDNAENEYSIDTIRAYLEKRGFGPEDYNIVGDKVVFKQKIKTKGQPKTQAPATKIGKSKKKKVATPLQEFYFQYGINPAFQYTPEGNLRADTTVIPILPFSPLSASERLEFETQQAKAIQTEEISYDLALAELRRVYAEYKTAQTPEEKAIKAKEVYAANKEVKAAVAARTLVAFPERWIDIQRNPEIRLIDMSQPKEDRTIGFDVYLYKRHSSPLSQTWGMYRAQPVADQEGGTMEETILIFTDPDHSETGLFHPIREVEFTVHGTVYASPYQAYEGERFRELQNETLRKQILGTRSARSIRSLVNKEYTQPNDPLGLWIEILEALFTQKKEMADALIHTGSAKFVSKDPTFVSTDFLSALESVRTKLQEGRVEKAPEVATESVITKEEQDNAKKAAIIHTFRKRRF
jgi:predicted NAD-dependent protein-ADP-ribosyltransferase YbiA (DUF1768 family)